MFKGLAKVQSSVWSQELLLPARPPLFPPLLASESYKTKRGESSVGLQVRGRAYFLRQFLISTRKKKLQQLGKGLKHNLRITEKIHAHTPRHVLTIGKRTSNNETRRAARFELIVKGWEEPQRFSPRRELRRGAGARDATSQESPWKQAPAPPPTFGLVSLRLL